MKRIVIIHALILLLLPAYGQINKSGVPIIRNYSSEELKISEYNYSCVSDHMGVMYFGTNSEGILRYDGSEWRKIEVGDNSTILSLEVDHRGRVYVGGSYEFGYLSPTEIGRTEYISLSDRLPETVESGIIYSMEEFQGNIYMTNLDKIFVYKPETDSLSWIDLREDYSLTKVVEIVAVKERLILADNREGLFQYDGEKVSRLPGGDFFKMTICLVLLPHGPEELVVGTYNNQGGYKYNYRTGNVDTTFFEPEVQEILKANRLYKGTNISDKMFALGSADGAGIFIFDYNGNLVIKLDEETSDLGDFTIYDLYYNSDEPQELWVATLGYISKVYLNLPYFVLDSHAGLKTGINRIIEFNGRTYLSTDGGVMVQDSDGRGRRIFSSLPGFSLQTFPMEIFHGKNEDLLLLGSELGLYTIDRNNKLREVTKYRLRNRDRKEAEKTYSIRSMLISSFHRNRIMLGTANTGLILVEYEDDRVWTLAGNINAISGVVTGIQEENANSIWLATNSPQSIVNIRITGADTIIDILDNSRGLNPETVQGITRIDGILVVNTSSGIYRYDEKTSNFIEYNELVNGYSAGKSIHAVFKDGEGDIWVIGKDTRDFLSLFKTSKEGLIFHRSVFGVLPDAQIQDQAFIDGKLWIAISKSVYVIDKERLDKFKIPFNSLYVRITVGADSVLMEESFPMKGEDGLRYSSPNQDISRIPMLQYKLNDVSFKWTTSYFIDEGSTEYSYMLEGFDNRWSKWSSIDFKDFTNLSSGTYIFRLKTKTITGLESPEITYKFVIKRPWYGTLIAFFLYVVMATLLILAIIKAYTRRLKNENIRLEGIVTERTAEVVKQKEELESSIHYASRIQRALLPSEKVLTENLNNYFILFKPRDIVSGDFYWMSKREDRLYLVVADCTGHGVPGAFMSLLGISFLDEIINQAEPVKADFVLNELRLHVTESLKQVGDDDEAKDGMDIAILVIDFRTRMIEFSGAYNPCFAIRKLTVEEKSLRNAGKLELPDGSMISDYYRLDTVYSDKMPIGISSRMDEPFTLSEWKLEKDITYYLFSDGYVDQFGGENSKKFMKRNFKKLLLEVQDLPIKEQKEVLEKRLREWMGDSPQIDDILVVGLRPE